MVREMQDRASKRRAKSRPKLNEDFSAQVKNSTARIGIIGMGYVGLPLMLACAAKNFNVLDSTLIR